MDFVSLGMGRESWCQLSQVLNFSPPLVSSFFIPPPSPLPHAPPLFLTYFFPFLSPSQKGGMVPWKDHWLWNQADLGLDLTSSTS